MLHQWSHWEFDPKLHEDIVNSIKKIPSIEQRLKLIALKTRWNQMVKLSSIFSDEFQLLRTKYNTVFTKLYSKMDRIQGGVDKLTEDDLRDYEHYFTKEELEQKDKLLLNLKPIPHYWYKAIRHSEISKLLLVEDKKILKKLTSLLMDTKIDYDESIHELSVFFAKNKYIENDLLRVTIKETSQGVYKVIKADQVKWKSPENPGTRFLENPKHISFFFLFVVIDTLDDRPEMIKIKEFQDTVSRSLVNDIIPNSFELFLEVSKNKNKMPVVHSNNTVNESSVQKE